MSGAPVDPNAGWDHIGDPYYPVDLPIADQSGPETDPEEEDPQEADPGEDSEEYMPQGYEWEHANNSGSDVAEIPQDAQEPPEEDLEDPGSDLGIYSEEEDNWSSDDPQVVNGKVTDEEEVMSAPPQPTTQREPQEYTSLPIGAPRRETFRYDEVGGLRPRQTAPRSARPVTARYLFGYNPIPQWGTGSHYEIGGSSQAPPPPGRFLPPIIPGPAPPPPALTVPPPRDAPTMAQHRHVVNQVQQLRDVRTEDSDAVHTLHRQVGADHSYANTMGSHIRALEFRLEVAERERLEMQGQLRELNRLVRRRLG